MDTIQSEIEAKGLNAPRVTPADLEAEIATEWYFNGGDAAVTHDNQAPPKDSPLYLLTFCVLVLKNGFTVTGESACVSAANFDAEIGKKVAKRNAMEKLWPLLGFRLADQLRAAADTGD